MTEQEWIKYKESAEYKQFRKDGFSDTEIKEIEETNEYPIVVIDDRKDNPILISKAIMIVLFGEDLNVIGLYINFISLQNFQWKNWKGQQVWEVLGFAKNSYYKYLNRLIDLGLVTPQGDYHKRTLRLNSFWLPESIKIVIGPEHQQKYMRKLKEKILLANPSKYQRENKKFTEEKQQQLQIETMAVEKAQEIVKKKEQKKKAEEKKFPGQDYAKVIEAYKKYKHVGLVGNEILRAKHAIKTMFLSERTPEQIIGCMKRFSELVYEPEYSNWIKHWTLETVMKKMPEFVAGEYKDRTYTGSEKIPDRNEPDLDWEVPEDKK